MGEAEAPPHAGGTIEVLLYFYFALALSLVRRELNFCCYALASVYSICSVHSYMYVHASVQPPQELCVSHTTMMHAPAVAALPSLQTPTHYFAVPHYTDDADPVELDAPELYVFLHNSKAVSQ